MTSRALCTDTLKIICTGEGERGGYLGVTWAGAAARCAPTDTLKIICQSKRGKARESAPPALPHKPSPSPPETLCFYRNSPLTWNSLSPSLYLGHRSR